MALITYANKSTGDTFTAANANEIKTVVNANAFNAANTATGTDTVTINATSGVATFGTTCATAPDITIYSIINSYFDQGNRTIPNLLFYRNLMFRLFHCARFRDGLRCPSLVIKDFKGEI